MKRVAVGLSVVVALALGAWALWPDDDGASVDTSSAEPAGPLERPTPVPQRAVPRGRVSGRVVRDGQPFGGARVTLRATAPLVARTLDDGAFLFDEVPAGVLYLSASAEGVASEVIGPLQLAEGGRLEGLTLVLNPSVRVEGRVVDLLTQRPIAGASVISASDALRTDEAGRFSLAGPRAQTWLEVMAPGYLTRTEWVSLELAQAGGPSVGAVVKLGVGPLAAALNDGHGGGGACGLGLEQLGHGGLGIGAGGGIPVHQDLAAALGIHERQGAEGPGGVLGDGFQEAAIVLQ